MINPRNKKTQNKHILLCITYSFISTTTIHPSIIITFDFD